jgi:hypothetical protein
VSILEEDNEQGFTPFVEYIALQGTKSFCSKRMCFGADENAYTYFNKKSMT